MEEDSKSITSSPSRSSRASSLSCWRKVAVLALFMTVLSLPSAVCGLKCYADVEAKQITTCRDREGFRTCFTKYNEKRQVTGRGCSTKDKVFYEECETHSYGDNMERMCFCPSFLCNAAKARPNLADLALITLMTLITVIIGDGAYH